MFASSIRLRGQNAFFCLTKKLKFSVENVFRVRAKCSSFFRSLTYLRVIIVCFFKNTQER